MKEKITTFIHNLIVYDYILFGSVFALFILLIILAILLHRKIGIAVFFVLFAFSILLLGPSIGYIQMHKYLYKNSVTLISQKKLHFTKAVVVKGTITNESKFHFKRCEITASAYKITKNKYKNMLMLLKPFQKAIIVQKNIPRGTSREFKMFIEPFTYSKEYNVSLSASCK